jgi:hypothetical protein
MDVIAPLVAYLQPPVAVHPRQGSFYDPPVAPQLLAGFDASTGYLRGMLLFLKASRHRGKS